MNNPRLIINKNSLPGEPKFVAVWEEIQGNTIEHLILDYNNDEMQNEEYYAFFVISK
jgi:hypothetical protein